MGWGFDDYMLTHTVEQLHAGVDMDTVDSEDELLEDVIESYEDWKKKRETPLIGRVNCTDLGNAERFFLREKGNLSYSIDSGWRHWDEKRLAADLTLEIDKRAAACVRKIGAEALQEKDEDRRKALYSWAMKSESSPRIEAMIKRSQSLFAVPPDIWDRDPYLFNCQNGTLNLKTATLHDHNKEDYITKLSNVNYDSTQQCPLWHEFLDRIMPNKETKRFLQKCVGYSLTGSIDEQCFFLLYGTGKNGKSTFLETIAALLGDYGGVMRTEALMLQKYKDTLADCADLRGLRFAYAVEPPAGLNLNTSFIKQQTGGEKLVGKILYHDQFSFRPTHKLWVGANHDIKIPETDLGIKRRVKQIPFKITIPETERDLQLGAKLILELSGVLNWALDGLSIYLIEGLRSAPEVDQATKEYFDRVDPLKEFFDEHCILNQDSRVKRSELHKKYLEWAKETGDKRPLLRRRFNERMMEKEFQSRPLDGYDYWYGIELK